MKILITTDLYTTATNGVVTSVRNLYDVLKHKGHDVRILTLSDKMNSYRDGDVYYIRSVSLEVVYPNVRMPMTYHHPLIDELIEWRPDVIHSQCEFFSFQFALRISKHTDAPIIHTYHTLCRAKRDRSGTASPTDHGGTATGKARGSGNCGRYDRFDQSRTVRNGKESGRADQPFCSCG